MCERESTHYHNCPNLECDNDWEISDDYDDEDHPTECDKCGVKIRWDDGVPVVDGVINKPPVEIN